MNKIYSWMYSREYILQTSLKLSKHLTTSDNFTDPERGMYLRYQQTYLFHMSSQHCISHETHMRLIRDCRLSNTFSITYPPETLTTTQHKWLFFQIPVSSFHYAFFFYKDTFAHKSSQQRFHRWNNWGKENPQDTSRGECTALPEGCLLPWNCSSQPISPVMGQELSCGTMGWGTCSCNFSLLPGRKWSYTLGAQRVHHKDYSTSLWK